MRKQIVFMTFMALLLTTSFDALAQSRSLRSPEHASAKTFYTCPMHPEIKAKKRGACPKCKMDLVRQTASVAAAPSTDTVASTGGKLNIPDVEVLDQDGNVRHFYRDLIKGKTVVLNFIFTNCTTICPPLGATFARVQHELGERVGKDVHFISVSVDPLTDTPERLKAWGAKFKAGAGWTFVTGSKPQVDQLLRALGASAARREDHTPSVIIGNDAKDIWTRTYGLAKTSLMVELIENVIAGRVNERAEKESGRP